MMPKHFQKKEKKIIYDRLIEEGKKSWGRYGIKRTNIEEICKAVGISKGSFYTFFDSKEQFLWKYVKIVNNKLKRY